jgi:chorismate synthase
MNSFGRLFRVSILGESHGTCVGVLIDGCPAGISLTAEDLLPDLDRRRAGAKGTTPRKESDYPIFRTGMFNDKTTGAPLLVLFDNNDTDSSAYEKIKDTPRPGHADFVAMQKFGGFNDYRGGGHFSGRLTAAYVAAGAIAKKVISPVKVAARITEIGGMTDTESAINQALEEGDSVGGILECQASGLPIGLGEPFFDSVESLLAHAVFAIPAVKGIEFGSGFASAKLKGSEMNDEILDLRGSTSTNNAGGINGGITNGNDLFFRIAVKPTSSIKKEKQTVSMTTGEQVALSVPGRHDACIALRVPPVLEAATAIVLADLLLLEQERNRVKRD